MKVYIVTQGEYSDYHIVAVFTDKEQAIQCCAVNENNYYEPAMIEEYETDEVRVSSSREVAEKWIGEWDSENKFRWFENKGFAFKEENKVEFLSPCLSQQYWRYRVKVFTPVGTTEEKAKKIAYDMLMKFIAEKLGV